MKFNLIILILTFHSIANGDVIVTIKNGQIKGVNRNVMNKTIHTFFGIRYAEPPIGSLRFSKPVPAKPWHGIYDATKYRHICMQNPYTETHNEDCLFINVATPVIETHSNGSKSVMVWIHGGGLQAGNGNAPIPLAAHDVVIVAFNYRLGPFGYLYGNSTEAPGNVGFWDMEMALKWVKDNIKYFGGNPNDITIFGLSAGGWSVGHLITSPITRDLFKRAILQSGSSYYYTGIGAANKSLNLHDAKQFAKDMGCHDESKWLMCLKEVDAKKIMTFNQSLYINMQITGDEFMPETSQKALKSGHFKIGTEIMAGVVSDEGSGYSVGVIPKFNDPHYHVTKEILKEHMKILIKYFYKRLTPHFNTEKLYDIYFKNITETDQSALKRRYGQIIGDFYLACPVLFFAHDYALYSNTNSVYFYEYTYRSSLSHSSHCTDWMGVCHGNDQQFYHGTPFLVPPENSKFTPQERQFSDLLMHLWTTFAKTGNPLSHTIPFPDDVHNLGINLTGIKWPKLIPSDGISVPKAMTLHPKYFGKIVTNLFHDTCDDYWKPYFL